MANKVDTFDAWVLLDYIYRSLCDITVANGYNTSPLVTMDLNRAREGAQTYKHVVWIEAAYHNAEDHKVGGRPAPTMRIGIQVTGWSTYETEFPRRLSMALEQDVRSALNTAHEAIRSATGRGWSFRFEECDYDMGFLSADNKAGFSLALSWLYPHNDDW